MWLPGEELKKLPRSQRSKNRRLLIRRPDAPGTHTLWCSAALRIDPVLQSAALANVWVICFKFFGCVFRFEQNLSRILPLMEQVSISVRARKPYVAWLKCRADQPASRCYVHEICASGAKIKVRNEASIPDEFELIFSRRGDARISCRMVSRRQQDLEVQFVPSARSSSN